jgi:hypothetical protein
LEAQQDAPPQQAEGTTQDQGVPPAPAPGPVAGVEQYRLDAPNLGRSFVVPRLSASEVYSSNVGYAPTTGSAVADGITTLGGGLSLQVVRRSSTLSLDASAGGLIYDTQTQPNGTIQNLAVTERVSVRRWNLLFGENLSYLPNSAFGLAGLGFAGGGATGYPGIGGVTGFNPGGIPTQTIGSPNVTQLSSSSSFQAQYLLSGSSSLTGSVVIGFLHFFNSTMLDSRQITPSFYYDHELTRRDTITVGYTAGIFNYPTGIPGFTTHYIQLGYRRLLTGRLNLSVLAGPGIYQFSPFTGMTKVPGGSTQVNWTLSSSLGYLTKRGSLSVTYSHAVYAGSGFYAGTSVDQVGGSANYKFSRSWTGGVTGSFAHNQTLQQTTPSLPANTTQSFTYWTAGAGLSRNVGRYSSLSFNYYAARQSGTTTVCLNGIPCGPIALVQVAGVSYIWSTRPLRLE